VLFVCEFNGWVEFTPYAALMPFRSLTVWAEQYGITSMGLPDGDVLTVRAAANSLLRDVRAGRPGFLLVPTSRLRGHYEGDSESYRLSETQVVDPMDLIRERVPPQQAADIETEVHAEIQLALAEARAAPFPRIDETLQP
jgi:pyruvate dehydrogenase E1 component alpha subunit